MHCAMRESCSTTTCLILVVFRTTGTALLRRSTRGSEQREYDGWYFPRFHFLWLAIWGCGQGGQPVTAWDTSAVAEHGPTLPAGPMRGAQSVSPATPARAARGTPFGTARKVRPPGPLALAPAAPRARPHYCPWPLFRGATGPGVVTAQSCRRDRQQDNTLGGKTLSLSQKLRTSLEHGISPPDKTLGGMPPPPIPARMY